MGGFNIQEFMHGCGWSLRQFHRSKDSLLTKVIHDCQEDPDNYNFLLALDAAAVEPDSLENSLLSMTTPEVLDYLQMESMMRLMLGKVVGRSDVNMPGKDADTQVKNVALISARVEEIYPPPHEDIQKIDNNSDPDAPLEDIYLTPHRNLRDNEPPAQIVAQLEVLYELQQSSIGDDKSTHDQMSM